MLQPPQPHVYFCLCINYDYWLAILYNLISSVIDQSLLYTICNGANLVMIEHSGAKQQRDKVMWFSVSHTKLIRIYVMVMQ